MTWFVLATCSAILSAAAAIAEKKALFRVRALEFSFFVALITAVIFAALPFSIDVSAVSRPALAMLVVKSLMSGSAFLLVMVSLQNNPISDALPLLGLTPAATALLALIATGESLLVSEWCGVVLMVAGAYLVEVRPRQRFWEPLRDAFALKRHAFIFGAVGLFAASSVMDRILVSAQRVDPLVVLFYQQIVYCIVFGALLVVRRASVRDLLRSGRAQMPLLLTVAILTIAYRYVQLEATKDAPAALVLAVERTSVFYASLIGGRLFSEERLKMRLLGAGLIVGSGFLILRVVT